MIKKIASFATAGAMFLGMAMPALAVECEINTTGPNSTNRCRAERTRTFGHDVKNTAKVKKVQLATADSGNNSASGNTNFAGGITTDNADAWVKDPVDANTTLLTVDQILSSDPTGGMITWTGPNSTNTTRLYSTKTAIVKIVNDADVQVTQTTFANTGNNTMNGNTIVSGDINTGKAEASAETDVTVNWTEITVNQ